MPDTSFATIPRLIMTVLGPVPYQDLGITDAHNHVWIAPVAGADHNNPILDQYDSILEELKEYRTMGGGTILDCQPGGCGRDGNILQALSKASGVNLIACTGFHRKKYYPPDYWLWSAGPQQVSDYLSTELEQGLKETFPTSPCKAGFIKIALEAVWADCPQAALEGAANAARMTKALVEIHTEKGALAEKACLFFMDRGILPTQLVLAHMDKRPDFSLHKALADLGVLLEYDTFFRPKYNPSAHLWPLIEYMTDAGLSSHVALATDLAEARLYHHLGGGPGLASLPGEINEQLKARGITEIARMQMLGGNITHRLAGIL